MHPLPGLLFSVRQTMNESTPALSRETTALLRLYAQRMTGEPKNAGRLAWIRSLSREELLEALSYRMFEVEAWLADQGYLIFGDFGLAAPGGMALPRPRLDLVIKAGTPAYLEAAMREYWEHSINVAGQIQFPADAPTIAHRPEIACFLALAHAAKGGRYLSFREAIGSYASVTAIGFTCCECNAPLPAARVRYRSAAKAHSKTPCARCFHLRRPNHDLVQMGLNLGFLRAVELSVMPCTS